MASEFTSYWVESTGREPRPPLEEDIERDVAVIGGGIAGVTAVLRLAREGVGVVLLEARRIGAGATGYTTAKLSSLHGLTYAKLARSLGDDTARIYGEANQAGLEAVAGLVEELGIKCDFRRKPNFTYASSDRGRAAVAQEAEVALRLGLPASIVDGIAELPVKTAGAIRFDDQAEFHPLRYLHALADAAADAGAAIHEGSRVVSVDQGSPNLVRTAAGATVRAEQVIVATHLPILDRGLYFARTHPERSYVLLARLGGGVPQGMYLSDESPAHSLRSVPTEKGELLMVGGESHKAGQSDAAERYAALESWARKHFDVASVEHRWATQDNMPADGLPFVGRLWPLSSRVLTATGFRKWGLAMGTAAAGILTDHVLGRANAWAETLSPVRLHPFAAGPELLKENANAGLRFFRDRLTERGSADELAPGEGAVVGSGLGQRAVYRDPGGELHSLSARCTHLGCIIGFNRAERTWDCPCHGSRFGIDGEVIEGPAVAPLEPRE